MAAVPATAQDPARNIEADPDLFDTSDSSLGDDVSQYTTSLTSSIEKYPIENGRRYHAFKDGSYIRPNDESEQDRLDLSHHMFKITMGNKLYLAPIGKPARILDIGTGTGIWAIEMGDDFPDSEILGTDLSPTQPTWVPANVRFEVDDVEEDWTFQHQFDFVHCRYLAAAITDWERLVRQCFEATKPGGYTEFQDYDLRIYSEDGSLTPEHAVRQWNDLGCGACLSFGKDPEPGPKFEGWMKMAGFVDVYHERFRLPIGPWPKDQHLKTIGAWNLVALENGLEGMTLRILTQVLGWKIESVQVLLANVRKDFRDPKIHAQLDFGSNTATIVEQTANDVEVWSGCEIRARSQPSQADPTVHGQCWSMEEAEWLYSRVFDGESVDFHNITKQMNGLFSIDREPKLIGSFARQFLQWRAPKLSPSARANSSDQILWIVGKANKGMLWKDMANLFNKKFNSNRTGEELKARYEEVRRALDPKMPDAERPDWAKNKNETFAIIQASVRGQSNGPKWKKEEDQLLDECRNRNMSWEQIAEELQRKFGIIRTPGALHARFKNDHRDQPGYKSTLKYKAWTQDEIDWLISEEKKGKKERTTMAYIAAQFERHFGYPRKSKNMDTKVRWLRAKKLV